MAAIREEAGESARSGVRLATIKRLLEQTNDDFLIQAYRIFLGRELDPEGKKAWSPICGSLPGRLRILASLWLSPERIYLQPWKRALLKNCLRFAGKKVNPR